MGKSVILRAIFHSKWNFIPVNFSNGSFFKKMKTSHASHLQSATGSASGSTHMSHTGAFGGHLPVGVPMPPHQSRKERFEEQLKALQNDISQLSHKLVNPPHASATVPTTISEAHSSASVPQHQQHNQSLHSNGRIPIASSSTLFASALHGVDDSQVAAYKEEVARLKQELSVANRDKDGALFRLEQANIELETIRNSYKETSKLRILYDQLKQVGLLRENIFDNANRHGPQSHFRV
jgi:hypothetical protein